MLPKILFTMLNGSAAKKQAGLAEQVGRVAANFGADNGKPEKPV
jgi:hypothetical protein